MRGILAFVFVRSVMNKRSGLRVHIIRFADIYPMIQNIVIYNLQLCTQCDEPNVPKYSITGVLTLAVSKNIALSVVFTLVAAISL